MTAQEQVLFNRGIPTDKQDKWLNAGWESINDWRLLNENKMRLAAQWIKNVIDNNLKVVVLVDADQDGWASSAIIGNYLFSFGYDKISYVQHENKGHGLNDTIDEILKYNPDLVFIPDAGSNNYKELKRLSDLNIKAIITDHHLSETDATSENVIVINSQFETYPNRSLCGGGVTWQFCRAFDEIYDYNFSKDLIDLCALAEIGDMMDYRESEVRAIVNLGLKNIHNPYFYNMIKENNYSINKMNGINYYSVAFYVVPYTNACVRSGTKEEKDIVFKSMLAQYAFDKVESDKRGHKGELVSLYEQAVLVATRVKRRQTKIQNEMMEKIEPIAAQDTNAMIIIKDDNHEFDRNLVGLVANKIQSEYQRPAAIVTPVDDNGKTYYRGSMRNYSRSEIQDLKSLLESTDCIDYIVGHANAAGISIPEEKISDLISKLNSLYKDIDQTPIYWVDYIWDSRNIDSDKILEIADLNVYGQEIPESMVAIKEIPIDENNVVLMSKDKHPTLKITCGDVSIIKFGSSEEEYNKFICGNSVLSVVGKCQKNEWMGKVSPQVIVEDFDIENKWVF